MLATMLSSHVGNGAVEVTWQWLYIDVESRRRQCCRVMLAMVLSGQLGRGAMSMSSHAHDNAAE
jgi:hypothetical protein